MPRVGRPGNSRQNSRVRKHRPIDYFFPNHTSSRRTEGERELVSREKNEQKKEWSEAKSSDEARNDAMANKIGTRFVSRAIPVRSNVRMAL